MTDFRIDQSKIEKLKSAILSNPEKFGDLSVNEIDAVLTRGRKKISNSIIKLLSKHLFLGSISLKLTREFSLEHETAWVSFNRHSFNMSFNPFFVDDLKEDEVTAIVQHEMYHLLNSHLSRMNDRNPRIWNVACDLSINPFIENLPKKKREDMVKMMQDKGLNQEEIKKALPKSDKNGDVNTCLMPANYDLPNNLTAEEYYQKIMSDPELRKEFEKKSVDISSLSKEEIEKLKEDIKSGKVRVTHGEDSHDEWNNNADIDDIQDAELKKLLKEAANECDHRYGNLPGNMLAKLKGMFEPALNWKRELKTFINNATDIIKKHTRKRPSRRFGIAFPGNRRDYKLNIGAVIDSSGSVSDEEITAILGELNNLIAYENVNVEIMAGDTQINNHIIAKKSQNIESFELKGRSGTCADSWIKYTNDHKYDIIVVLTDGEFSYDIEKSKCPALWVLTKNGADFTEFNKNIPFGKVTKFK